MKDIRIFSLFSGSSGNCHYLKLGEKEILIDAGKNAKAITTALTSIGADIKGIDDIYITHDHSDHVAALRVLQKKNPGLLLHLPSACREPIERGGADISRALTAKGGERYTDGAVSVIPFDVPHDAHACLGYRIEYKRGEDSISVGIATDIGHLTLDLTEGLCGCDAVIVESNHDVGMLINGPYPEYLKHRILSACGHLSNEACAKLCSYLSGEGTRHIMLAHISKENNTPKKALEALSSISGSGVRVLAAKADTPVCLYEE